MKATSRKSVLGGITTLATVSLAVSGWSVAASASTQAAKKASGGSSKLVKTAEKTIHKYLNKPKFVAPGPKVDAAKAKGEKVLIVAHDQVSDLLVNIAKGAEQAGAKAGLQVSLFNANSNPSAIQQGIQQGINEKVGAILLDGVAANLVPSSLQAASAAHIPLIGLSVGAPGEGLDLTGFNAEAAGSNTLMGELIADEAIAQGNGKVHAIVETFNNPDSQGVEAGIKKVFKKCKTCKIVATRNVTPTGWPTQLAPATSSLVRANPTANFVLPTADTMGIFATTGVNQAGATSKVKVVSADGSGAGPLALVKSGPVFVADPGVNAYWVGWEAIDQALRLMTGMKPGNAVVPLRFLSTSNLANVNVNDQTALYGSAYQSDYLKLWGIS